MGKWYVAYAFVWATIYWNILCGPPTGLNPRLISSHMFSKTNSFVGSSGWAILVCSHFSFPHINVGFNLNPFLNTNWNMGKKLRWVVDDHIPKSNFKEHNCKNSNKFNQISWAYKLNPISHTALDYLIISIILQH